MPIDCVGLSRGKAVPCGYGGLAGAEVAATVASNGAAGKSGCSSISNASSSFTSGGRHKKYAAVPADGPVFAPAPAAHRRVTRSAAAASRDSAVCLTPGAGAAGGLIGRPVLQGLSANRKAGCRAGDENPLEKRGLRLRLGYGFAAFGDRFFPTPMPGPGRSSGYPAYSPGWFPGHEPGVGSGRRVHARIGIVGNAQASGERRYPRAPGTLGRDPRSGTRAGAVSGVEIRLEPKPLEERAAVFSRAGPGHCPGIARAASALPAG